MAYGIIGIAQHNMISVVGLGMMMGVDALFHFYIVIMMILQQMLDLTYLNMFNVIQLFDGTSKTNGVLLIVQGTILGLFLAIGAGLILVTYRTHSMETLNDMPTLKKSMTVIFLSLLTYLQIPFLEIILSAWFIEYNAAQAGLIVSTGISVLIYLLSSINLVLLLLYAFMFQKLFIIRIPSLQIHWAASNTQLHSMKLINRVFLVVCHLYVTTTGNGMQFFYLTIPALILFVGTGYFRVMLIPHYRTMVEWGTRLTELITACLLLVLVLAQIIVTLAINQHNSDNSNPLTYDLHICLLVSFVCIPCTLGLCVVVDIQRRKQLWAKMEQGTLKMEIELEYALYLLIERVKTAMGSNDESTLAFADLLYLVDVHNRSCTNHACPCHKRQIVQYLMSKGSTINAKRLVLEDDEIALINSAGSNDFIHHVKNSQKQKPLTLLQYHNFYSAVVQSDLNQSNDGESKQEVGDKNKMSVRINLAQLKLSFINQFSCIFFEEAKKRFPQSKCLFFQYAYFSLQCCRNKYMTETLLRNFENIQTATDKTSWVEKVCVQVNELQTIMEIEKLSEVRQGKRSLVGGLDGDDGQQSESKNWGITYLSRDKEESKDVVKNSQYTSLDRFDPEYFVLISQLTQQFFSEVEHLAVQVQNFWKLVQQDTIDVDYVHTQSINLADNIARVYKIFKEIELASEGGPGSGRTQDFRVCYTFALLQKLLLNDIGQYDLYVSKINSLREMVRLLKNNMLQIQSQGPEDTGFIIVHGQNRNFGNIILCNQLIRKELMYSQKELKHMNIVDFMPSLIKQWHNGFIQDFSKNGLTSTGMLNRTNCVFIKRKNGFVVPAMINIRFHYSRDFDFTFVCFISFMTDIQVQRSAGTGRHKVEEVLFFLCDDPDWRVLDISESCSKQLGVSMQFKHNNDLETALMTLSVEDMCPSLSLQRLQYLQDQSDSFMLNGGAGQNNSEEIVDVDLNVLINMGKSDRHQANARLKSSKTQKALCQVFTEHYGPDRDKRMNIIALVLLDQIAMQQYLLEQRMAKKKKRVEISSKPLTNVIEQEQEYQDQSQVESVDGSQFSASLYESGSESHSSRGTSESSVLKQLYSSTEKTASSSLKLVMQLILLVYVLLLVVSTINLALSLTRFQQLQNEVTTTRLSFDQFQSLGRTRLQIRSLANIANNYEPNTLPDNANRYADLTSRLGTDIGNLQSVQNTLDTSIFQYSTYFSGYLKGTTTNLDYIDNNNIATIQNQTFSYALNLYDQRAAAMALESLDSFVGTISQLHIESPPSPYSPTDNERTMYFLTKTSQDNIRAICQNISALYLSETQQHALSVAQQTEITIILSIVAIILIGLIVSPIICRIEQRKYMGLQFFLKVDHQYTTILDQYANDFLQVTFSDKSILPANSQIESILITDKKKLNTLNNQYKFQDFEKSNREGAPNLNASAQDQDQRTDAQPQSNDSSSMDSSTVDQNMVHLDISTDSFLTKGQSKRISNVDFSPRKKQEDQSQQQMKTPAEVKKELKMKHKMNKQSVIKEAEAESEDSDKEEGQQDENQGEEESASDIQNARISVQNMKYQRIAQTIFKKKVMTVVQVTMISVCFTAYFIAGYFFSVDPFLSTPSIISNLYTIFSKDSSLTYAMAIIRDNYILNSSLPAIEDETVLAAEYYLNMVQSIEDDYLNFRKNVPTAFQGYPGYQEVLESSELCYRIYWDWDNSTELINECNQAYNGVMQNGITYVTNVVFTRINNLYMNFMASKRPKEFLINALKDQDTLELLQLKIYQLDDALFDLKDHCQLSVTMYYQSLINQYSAIYAVFVFIMTVLFMLFMVLGYGFIKDSMWKTNLTLKILPLDFIPRECLPELKAFFKY